MTNLDLWFNQQTNNNEDTTTTISNFENCLLSIKDQYQKIRLNSDHPTSNNERYEKIIEMIDHTLKKYKEAVNNENNIPQQQQQQQQQQNEYEEEEKELLIIINNIFNELDRKRKIAINKNNKDLRDQIESYRLEETTLDYILYIILEFAGKLI